MFPSINGKILLWALGTLHFQLLLSMGLFAILPGGYGFWHNALIMLGLMLVFGINVIVGYLIGISWSSSIDDSGVLGVWAIWSIGAIVLGVFALNHFTLANAKVKSLDLEAAKSSRARFAQLQGARILTQYTLSSYSVHFSQAKGQSPKSYRVAQRMAPLVDEAWTGAPIQHFVAYHGKSSDEFDFDLKYVAGLSSLNEFSAKYPSIAKELIEKYQLRMAANPSFWELRDLPQAKLKAQRRFQRFYAILMGTAVLVFGFFGFANKQHGIT